MYTTVSSRYESHFALLMQDIHPQIQESVPHPMIEKKWSTTLIHHIYITLNSKFSVIRGEKVMYKEVSVCNFLPNWTIIQEQEIIKRYNPAAAECSLRPTPHPGGKPRLPEERSLVKSVSKPQWITPAVMWTSNAEDCLKRQNQNTGRQQPRGVYCGAGRVTAPRTHPGLLRLKRWVHMIQKYRDHKII